MSAMGVAMVIGLLMIIVHDRAVDFTACRRLRSRWTAADAFLTVSNVYPGSFNRMRSWAFGLTSASFSAVSWILHPRSIAHFDHMKSARLRSGPTPSRLIGAPREAC
jgi:hypothetical protein